MRALALAATRYRDIVIRDRSKLGPTASAALGRLHLDGPQTPTELAGWLNLSTGAVTEPLDRLENAGYARPAPHPTDRRRVIVSLTESACPMIIRELLAR